MRRLLIAAVFLSGAFYPVQSEADCKKCKTYFDYQVMRECKYCIDSACGGYSCTVLDMGTWEYCDLGDDEDCFTYYGVEKGWCGPRQQDLELRPPAADDKQWRLVRVRTYVAIQG
jgi:hypothetical protein